MSESFGCVPPSKANRLLASRAMSASSPARTKAVFSRIPVSSRARTRSFSSIMSVVRICISMHQRCISHNLVSFEKTTTRFRGRTCERSFTDAPIPRSGNTKASRLAVLGASNGGLLMGAALTQHPELYCAVVSLIGIYDMLRDELSPKGAFNTTEFGTVKEPDQFRALFAYSPYHHVRDGTAYPAILFATGANDPRVDPMHSRKMTARLHSSGSKKPVLLRTSSTSGHGIGTALSEQIDELTDIDEFLFAQWGLE